VRECIPYKLSLSSLFPGLLPRVSIRDISVPVQVLAALHSCIYISLSLCLSPLHQQKLLAKMKAWEIMREKKHHIPGLLPTLSIDVDGVNNQGDGPIGVLTAAGLGARTFKAPKSGVHQRLLFARESKSMLAKHLRDGR